MSNWPTSVTYAERLSLSPTGQPTTVSVSIPSTRADAFDQIATIDRLFRTNPAEWQAMVRMYTACDWYVLALFMSGSQRIDPFTGRPEIDCDFQFNYAREMQFDGDNVLDKSARGHWKTTWRGYVGITNAVLLDPNTVIAFVAHEKLAAARHGVRTMLEWENNVELKAAWPDVFFTDPKRDPLCPLWNQETGCTVRRTIGAALPTLSWHAIEHVPTGGRVSIFLFDDLETEDTVETDNQREKTLRRFSSFKQLAGRMPRAWINGTHHHPNGLVAHIERSQMYRVRCHPAEDVSRPAPDIAALYDACGGKLQLRGETQPRELPVAVRDIRLDGAPVYLHPMELALRRLDALATPGGLADYHRQMMGNALAGEEMRLDVRWIRRYQCRPEDMAEGAYIYIVVDASRGVNDPTFARVEACRSDQSIAWVGGLRKRIPPSDFGREIWQLACRWEHIGQIREVRFEIFGQAVWDELFIQECENMRHWPGNITRSNVVCCGRNKVNRTREWMALEPLYRNGRRLSPEHGVMFVEDENRRRFDLVEYYERNEYSSFPLPITDDGLAADSLLGEPEDPARGIFALEFPESDEEMEMRERREMRRMRSSGWAGDDDRASWMSEGL